MAIQISSTEVISNTRVLKNVTIDPSVPIPLPSYVVQTTFTGSGTFTKNADDLFYLIKVWSGGGGGAKLSSNAFGPGSGGGGGGYGELFVLAPQISGPVTVTVGAGGQQVDAPAPPFYPLGTRLGTPGGTSSFGTYMTVSGGSGALLDSAPGGELIAPPTANGGGAVFYGPPGNPKVRAGIIAGGGDVPIPLGGPVRASGYWGGGIGASHSPPRRPVGYSIYGGGGGGVLNPPSLPPGSSPFSTGGTSVFGGAGGNYPNGNGSVRGGGGAGMEPTANPANQGRGGRGEVQIIAWRK
jgi:hypothetical protein